MKKIVACTVVVAMLSVTGCGRRGQPIYNVSHRIMPMEVESLSDTERGMRIRLAAKKNGWICREKSPHKMSCRVHVRSYSATVEIDHNKHDFSVNYLDSSGLRHNKGRIHPKYNQWVRKLERVIERDIDGLNVARPKSTFERVGAGIADALRDR